MANQQVDILLKLRDQATQQLKQAGREVGQVSKSMQQSMQKMQTASFAVAAGVAAAGAGAVIAVKEFAEFEKELTNVATLMEGDVTKNVKQMKREIMGIETPTGLKELAEGMFFVKSAGIEAAESVEFLTESNKLAIAGATDTATSIQAVVGFTKAYGEASIDAAKATDLLFQINKKGFTTFEEIAEVIPRIASSGALLGVTQEELAASMATLVGATGNANEVATQLRGIINALAKPSTELQKALEGIGFSSSFAAVEALGFQGTLEALREESGGTDESFSKLFNNVRALSGVIPLAGNLSEKFTENLGDMAKASGSVNKAFEVQANSVDFLYQSLTKELSKALVEIGAELMPMASEALKTAIPIVKELGENIVEFVKFLKENEGAVIAMATAITFSLVPALWALVPPIAAATAALAPLTAIGLAIGAIGGALYQASVEWEKVNKMAEEFSKSSDHWREQAAAAEEYAKTIEDVSATEAKLAREKARMQRLQSQLDAETQRQLEARAEFGAWWGDEQEKIANRRIDQIRDELDAQTDKVMAIAKGASLEERLMKQNTKLSKEQFDQRWEMAKEFFGTNEEAINQFLQFNKDASVEELKLQAKKINEQSRIVSEGRKQWARVVAVPLIQEVRAIVTDGDSSMEDRMRKLRKAAIAAFKQSGGIYEKVSARLGEVNTELTEYKENLDKIDGGGGGGGAADQAEAAAEAQQKLADSVKDLNNDFIRLNEQGGKNFEQFLSDHQKSLADFEASLVKLDQELTRIDDNMKNMRSGIAENIVEQEQLIADLRKQLEEAATPEEAGSIQDRLEREEKALREFLEKNKDLEEEVAEERRRANLTEFERYVEDIQKKKDEMEAEAKLRKAQIEEEKQAIEEQKNKEIEAYNQKMEAYNALRLEFGIMKDEVESGMDSLAERTVEDVDIMLQKLAELEMKMKELGVETAPRLTAADTGGATKTGNTSNNVTINVNGGGNAREIAEEVMSIAQREIELSNQGSQ